MGNGVDGYEPKILTGDITMNKEGITVLGSDKVDDSHIAVWNNNTDATDNRIKIQKTNLNPVDHLELNKMEP